MFRKKSIQDIIIVILLIVFGITLLFINRHGEDTSIKINWGIGVGLIVGSITHVVDRVSKLLAKWEELIWEGRLDLFYITLLFVAGFLVLLYCSDNWRYLSLGIVLISGSLTYFGTHIRKVEMYLLWICIVFYLVIISVITWSLIKGLVYTDYEIALSILLIFILVGGIAFIKFGKKLKKTR